MPKPAAATTAPATPSRAPATWVSAGGHGAGCRAAPRRRRWADQPLCRAEANQRMGVIGAGALLALLLILLLSLLCCCCVCRKKDEAHG